MKYYNLALEKFPQAFKANKFKGRLLIENGNPVEAIAILKKLLQWNYDPGVCYYLGNAYEALGNQYEAMKSYRLVDSLTPTSSLGYCDRGQCYNKLGKREEALADFKKSQSLFKSEDATFAPYFINVMEKAFKAIFDIEQVADLAKAELEKLSSTSHMTKFTTAVEKLQKQKAEIQTNLLNNANKNKTEEVAHNVTELAKIKEEFQKQLDEMHKEMSEVKSQVKTLDNKVNQIQANLEEMKIELDNKLTDFEKKLDAELDKQDLIDKDREKLKGYYRAFVQTFSCVHVTSQVIDSGQVQLDSGSSATTILSFVASFAPFVGDALSQGISTIGEFLKSQEMIKNARRMKNLAIDASKLSQLIGNAAFEILQNKEKQQKIINVTESDLEKISGNLFEKIQKFCENMKERVDTYLYTDLYENAAQRSGHIDANKLIEMYLKGKITPFVAREKFVSEILNPTQDNRETEKSDTPRGGDQGRSSCCNVF